MIDINKTILVSKREFDTKLNKNNANISSRKFNTGEKFKFIEYAQDSKTKYVLITPLLKKRDDNCTLLFNLNSLKSHFYIKRA